MKASLEFHRDWDIITERDGEMHGQRPQQSFHSRSSGLVAMLMSEHQCPSPTIGHFGFCPYQAPKVSLLSFDIELIHNVSSLLPPTVPTAVNGHNLFKFEKKSQIAVVVSFLT